MPKSPSAPAFAAKEGECPQEPALGEIKAQPSEALALRYCSGRAHLRYCSLRHLCAIRILCARSASLRAICILATHLHPCARSATLRTIYILAPHQLRALSILQSSAGGTTQLSPALQRWVCRQTRPSVPEGRPEIAPAECALVPRCRGNTAKNLTSGLRTPSPPPAKPGPPIPDPPPDPSKSTTP